MKTLVTLSFLFLCFFVNAQRSYQDVVYSKDGSIIRGMIIEIVPNQSLKIQTSDMSVFNFKFEDIEKITKERTPRVFDAQKAVNQNNFAFFMEPGLSIFLGDYQGIRTFSFSALAGYRYKNVISVGLSAGVDVGTSRSVIVPAGIGIRGNFLPKKSATPFFDFNAGYTYNNFISAASGSLYYNTVEEKPHGVFYSPALGVKYWFSSTAAITLKAGYYGIMIPGDFNVAIHAFQLKLGMEF